jgi:flagellar biosynthesis/type III secretory pathway chaperone
VEPRDALSALLATLEEEETEIVALLELAAAEHSALISSDFTQLDDITARMLRIADRLEHTESRRTELLHELGTPGAGLREVADLAEHHGMNGFTGASQRLMEITAQLQEAQEQNARLILSAARLRERWLAMLTRMANPTYTPEGASGDQGYRFVSKSA